jgi:hypothetical protein
MFTQAGPQSYSNFREFRNNGLYVASPALGIAVKGYSQEIVKISIKNVLALQSIVAAG